MSQTQQYFMVFDSSGNPVKAGLAINSPLPTGAIACTQVQQSQPNSWLLQNGTIVENPSNPPTS